MKMTLKRMVALVLAVLLVACFHFTALGEEAAALPVNVRIITLNLGSTEYYYDGLILKANVENGSGAGARWQICQAYVDGGSNVWADYGYAETITVTVVPGIENWAIRCILPTGEMSQDFRVNKDFAYRPVEEPTVVEEVVEESVEVPVEVEGPTEEPAAVEEAPVTAEEPVVVEVPVEAPVEEAAPVEVPAVEETPTEVVVPAVEETPEKTEEEIEIVVTEEEDDDEVFFDDDELVEFDDDDWGTTEGSDFSELDNLANGIIDDAAEADNEEVNEENEEEKVEVTEKAETETPAVEAEEITEVVVAEEENTEEYEEVIEKTETKTVAVEGEEISEIIVTEDGNSVELEEQTEVENKEIFEPYVDIEVYWEGEDLYFGDTITLTAHAYNVEGLEYDILWQSSKDDATWRDEGYGDSISYIVTKANQWDYWQAVIVLK